MMVSVNGVWEWPLGTADGSDLWEWPLGMVSGNVSGWEWPLGGNGRDLRKQQ